MDLPTQEDLMRVAQEEMLSRNQRLSLDALEREASELNILSAGMAAVGDEVTAQLARAMGGMYLDSAAGELLDRLVFDRYGLTRKPASQAMGTVVFSTTAAAPSSFAIARGTKLGTSDGRQFIVWQAATFTAGSTGPLSVEVRSVLSGSEQQARPGTITSILSQISGAPADLVVTNTLATAGADDAEKDDALRNRARQFFATARRGTVSAIRNAALQVTGVRTAQAQEVLDPKGRPARAVELWISDAFTDALVAQAIDPPTYATQSQTLATSVAIALEEWRAAGIQVHTQVAQVVLQGITLGLRFEAGVDVDAVAYEARALVMALVNNLSPGDDLDPSVLVAGLRSIAGLTVTGDEVLSPSGVVVAAPLQVLRTALALVVASTIQPDRALQGNANADGV